MLKSYISKYNIYLNNTKDWWSEHPELDDKLWEKMFVRVLYIGPVSHLVEFADHVGTKLEFSGTSRSTELGPATSAVT